MSGLETHKSEEDNCPADVKVMEWTTWDELLLASAVKRHGLKDWDTVAMELQTRSFPNSTPEICQHKFHDLKRRYTTTTGHEVKSADDDVKLPWFEDLRSLRVAELKEEIQRSDLFIESLKSKAKRLEDDRERSLKEDEEKTDLARKDKSSANSIKHKEEEERSEKEEKRDGGQSFNESNSTENRAAVQLAMEVEVRPETVTTTVVAADTKVGEDSCNDSSDRGKVSKERKVESSSDVQSSASLTRKKRKIGGGDEGTTTTTAAAAATTGMVVVKSASEELLGFLDIIRSHKHASLFERRLDSQKTDKYKKMVRRHVDLRTIQKRIEDGSYNGWSHKFYLDLLIVLNNAIVFFPRSSHQSLAAHELREVVTNQMMKKPECVHNNKSNLAPLLVCKKRSSIAAKGPSTILKSSKPPAAPAAAVVKSSSEDEETEDDDDEEEDEEEEDDDDEDEDDDGRIKLNLKEKRIVTGVRSMRRNSRGGGNNNLTTTTTTSNNTNSSSSHHQHQHQPLLISDKKLVIDNNASSSSAAKKRGAADFLKRIKKNSPPSNDETKRKKVGTGGPLRRSGNGKQMAKEDNINSPSKRSVGRPPKKGKQVLLVGKKREGEHSSKRPNKRSRR